MTSHTMIGKPMAKAIRVAGARWDTPPYMAKPMNSSNRKTSKPVNGMGGV